jgi:group I intron endonuclease
MEASMSARILSGIYVIRNTVNGKVYVGSAVDLTTRWGQHRYLLDKRTHHCRYLQHAWTKHGAIAFVFEVIETIQETKGLIAREQVHLDDAFASGLAYNISRTAGSVLGVKHTEETRMKVSAAGKGRVYSLERNAKISASRKGKKRAPFSLAARINMGLASKGRTKSPETRAKSSAALKGIKRPAELMAKLRALNTGRKHSAQSRANMSAARKGVLRGPHSMERRMNISKATKGKPGVPHSPPDAGKNVSGRKKEVGACDVEC